LYLPTVKQVIAMKTIILLIVIFTSTSVFAQEMYTVYLVRHAEKDLSNPGNKNPKLLPCGTHRAESLAETFKDIDLKTVYSTNFERTRSTATPTAVAKNLEVQIYNPDQLGALYSLITDRKHNALIVGHSDTTNVLAGKLAGIVLAEIDEAEYDRLYQVVIAGGSANLQMLHQSFRCAK
jgi:broad specificity phosphatase PhoE